jgi:hypothetical protein
MTTVVRKLLCLSWCPCQVSKSPQPTLGACCLLAPPLPATHCHSHTRACGRSAPCQGVQDITHQQQPMQAYQLPCSVALVSGCQQQPRRR